jgi:diacylglycerol kinase family enzyme
LRRARYVKFWKTACLECEPLDSRAIFLQVDGEPHGRLPAQFKIVPDALTLAMPSSM